MRDLVFCITHVNDFYNIDLVMAALKRGGFHPMRVNADRFPMSLQLSTSPEKHMHHLAWDDQQVDLDRLAGVWLRKLFPPILEEDLGEEMLAACQRESSTCVRNFFDLLDDVPWIDRPTHVDRAKNKLLQLKLAQGLNIRVPDTLISNDPQRVRDFYEACDGQMVTKMLTTLSTSMDRPERFVYTSKVSAQDLAALDGLRYSPMVFQKNIAKACELRVAYVDGETFVGRIDAANTEEGADDWRRANLESPWQRDALPESERIKLQRLMEDLKLTFGAVDYIRTPEDEYVFLEVNPAGEWGMLQKFLDLPIAEAIARALIKRMEA